VSSLQRFLYTGEGAWGIPMFGLAVLGACALLERRHRPKVGHCAECGYDLTGNISGRCPECGTPTSSPATGRPRRQLVQRLAVEIVFAAGAALSFAAAYDFWITLKTRPAMPSSYHPLYLAACSCGVFLWGLIHVLRRDRKKSPFDLLAIGCFATGTAFMVCDLCLPVLWR